MRYLHPNGKSHPATTHDIRQLVDLVSAGKTKTSCRKTTIKQHKQTGNSAIPSWPGRLVTVQAPTVQKEYGIYYINCFTIKIKVHLNEVRT